MTNNCAIEIRKVMLKRAKSIELMPEIQDSCGFDLARFCSNPEAVRFGEELRCLQANYKELDKPCMTEVLKTIESQNKDLRLDQILYNACLPTIDTYCADKRDEKGALLECLIKQKNNRQMQSKCRVGIEHHQLLNLNDILFNFMFLKACKGEISSHCMSKKTKLEVVYCLSELVLNDTLLNEPQRISVECRKELRFELLQTNENINLDPELAQACVADMGEFCGDVKAGNGDVLECLRTNQLRPVGIFETANHFYETAVTCIKSKLP